MPGKVRRFRQSILNFITSIRFRLTLWSLFILSLVLLVFSSVVYTSQSNDLKANALNDLEVKTRQIQILFRLVDFQVSINGTLTMPDLTQNFSEFIGPNDSLTIMNTNGQVLLNNSNLSTTQINELLTHWKSAQIGQSSLSYQLAGVSKGNNNRNYLFLLSPLPIPPYGILILMLGQPIDPLGQLNRLFFTLLFASLATLLVALLGGYWLATRAMRPVKMITRAAREIGETDLRKRLNLKSKDELGELANTFDQMLNRLESAFDRQRQFTADASHELRTPLTIVGLEANRTLSRRRSPEEYENALQIIKSENEFMARLVNDLLTLARMDAGQTMLKFEVLDLSDLALEAVERLYPLAHNKGIELLPGDLPELKIMGDRQYLTQMLSNLVDNAIKYVNGNGKYIKVETGYRIVGTSPQAWVTIEDNGPGIAEEHLPHLFDRFYRVDKARSRQSDSGQDESKDGDRPSGSGLGLSIVQWIAQAHGGQVSVRSQVNQGTVFEIVLPLLEIPEPVNP
jgi:signal transduction histidine kinase